MRDTSPSIWAIPGKICNQGQKQSPVPSSTPSFIQKTDNGPTIPNSVPISNPVNVPMNKPIFSPISMSSANPSQHPSARPSNGPNHKASPITVKSQHPNNAINDDDDKSLSDLIKQLDVSSDESSDDSDDEEDDDCNKYVGKFWNLSVLDSYKLQTELSELGRKLKAFANPKQPNSNVMPKKIEVSRKRRKQRR